MLCKHCGQKIPTGTDVCPECHGNLSPNAATAKPNAVLMKEETDHIIIWYLKKKAVFWAAAVLVILAAASVAVPAVVSLFDRVDYTAFIQIEVSGYDGRGNADVQIDTDALSSRLFGKPADELDSEEQRTLSQVTSLLWSGLESDGSRTGLSNGDMVTYHITNLEALSKAADKKCKDRSEITYTVEGLLAARSVGFDELFDVTFTGSTGNGGVLVTPKADNADWTIQGYGDEIYIQDYAYVFTSQSGNAGTLSNGDEFTIGVVPLWDDNTEYFLETYGAYISDQEVSYTVSGLSEAQSVDVFSLVETAITGVDGAGTISYHWDQEEYVLGGVRIVPSDSQSSRFSMYVAGSQSSGITFQAEGTSADAREQDLGRFYLTADQDGSISAGSTVTVSILSDYFDDPAGALSAYGVALAATEKAITVDAAMIPRYVTSMDQVNAANLGALAGRMGPEVTNALNEDWSRIIHKNSNYICYDQTIVAGPAAHEAFLVRMDQNSNSYAVWIVYGVVVTDSELEGNASAYALMRLNDPVVYQDGDNTINYNGSMRLEFYDSLDPIRGNWWYQSEESYRVTFG